MVNYTEIEISDFVNTSFLKGEKGEAGKDGFSPRIEEKINTEEEYILTITDGNGSFDTPNLREGNGEDGKSAYELAVENGFTGTEEEWIQSLNGRDGEDGQNGANGLDGKSAYELAVENGFTGTEEEWLQSLKGDKGEPRRGCTKRYVADWSNITVVCRCGSE